jgi:hypothetical protein
MIKVKKGDLDSNSILNRWKGHYCQLLNVHWADDVIQADVTIDTNSIIMV